MKMNMKVNRGILENFKCVLLLSGMLVACGGETTPGTTCSDTDCTTAPAATCQGDNLISYNSQGTCNDEGECTYEQEVTNCVAQDAQCIDGACVPNGGEDLCADVVCDAPPALTCNGNSVVAYADSGECVGGICQYDSTETACADTEVCENGACVPAPDPCDGVVCDAPPAPSCDGDALVTYAEEGQCTDGTCSYGETSTACTDGQICLNGACIETPGVNLVITEIHYNPAVSQGDDSDFEFIEIYNGGLPVNLAGYSFSAGVTHTFESYEFESGTYLVVAVNALSYPGLNAVQWTSGSLSNSGETITLVDADGAELDTVAFDDSGDWTTLADGAGYSLELMDMSADNNVAANWRASYIQGGTPGDDLSSPPTTVSLTINDIRLGDHVGDFVTTGGIVTGAFPDMGRFSVQSGTGAYSAIWVEGVGVAQGDSVEVTGPVVDDSGRLMVWGTEVTVLNSGEDMPEAEVLTTLGAATDEWEAVVVEVTATCTQPELGYGEWGIDDGSGMLRVDDLGYVYETPIEGIEYRVRGPLDYSFDAFKIALRDATDVALVDPCSVVTCDAPPVDICDGNSVLTYEAAGTCNEGVCFYASSATDCGGLECVSTETGASCEADPCDAFDCSQPQTTCDGNSVVSYSGDGVCTGAGGCDFSTVETLTDCGTAQCYAGACYVFPSAESDLIITEYMANPNSTDTNYEWFEVYNPLATDLYVGGMVVSDAGSDSFTVADGTVIAAFDHFVFGQSADAVPLGPDYNWSEVGSFLLANGDDEIILTYDSVVIDSVAYDDCAESFCFPDPSGSSVSLDGGSYAADNANGSLWCTGSWTYDTNGNLGSPGAANDTCPVVDPCDGLICNTAPVASCDGNTAVTYEATGTCDGGVCSYAPTETGCGDDATCSDGVCLDNADPCADVVCEAAPDDYCTGDVATVHEAGVCTDGVCAYGSTDTDCSLASQVCEAGTCITETASYNIVINELYYNSPTSQGDDNQYEFLELYNAGDTVNLEGCSFSAGVTHTFESLAFEAGAYLVLTVNASSYASLSATVVEWASGGLNNSGEAVTLVDPNGAVIDTVTYDDGNGWPAAADGGGSSLELVDVTTDNAESSNWQASTVDNGTPGAANSEVATITSYTIAQINSTDVVGEAVTTEAVVTGVYSGSTNRFSVSDGTGAGSGLWVQGSDAVAVGEQVTIVGTVSDSNGLLKIELTTVRVNSSGNALPEPLVLGTGALLSDDYVGVLVQTSGSCDNADLGYGEWSIDDGSGALRIDDLGYDFAAQAVGISYQVTAPLFYSYSNYKLVPRSVDDVSVQ